MRLPLLVSVPHAGLRVPAEAEPYCILTQQQIVDDGDEGASGVYDIASEVAALVTTDVARAIMDVNRSEDERHSDGVVKTHTCWNVPVYKEFPPEHIVERLLERYYRPYHARLRELAGNEIRLGVDCHTMAVKGPPIGPDAGRERPWICLSNAHRTCPDRWLEALAACFRRAFNGPVTINSPFVGGYIIEHHSASLPWVQLEVSRGMFLPDSEKRVRVLSALREWCRQLHSASSQEQIH